MNKLIKIGWWVPLLIVAMVIFLLPTKNYWLGDQYSLNHFLEKYDNVEKIRSIEDGAFFISPLVWPIVLAIGFKAWSIICGIMYLFLAALFIRTYGNKWMLLLILPLIQLFCSYIEVYSGAIVFMLLTYYFYRKGDAASTFASAVVTILMHAVVGASVIPLVGITFLTPFYRKHRVWKAFAACSALSIPVLVLMFGGFTRESALVPITGEYSLFSLNHLVDMAFLFVLNFLWILGARSASCLKDWVFPLAGMGIAFLIDSHLGVVRDWDLLSACLFPVTLVVIDKIYEYKWIYAVPTIVVTILFLTFNSTNRTTEMVGIMSASPQYTSHPRAQRNIVVADVILNNEEHSPGYGQYLKWNWENYHNKR